MARVIAISAADGRFEFQPTARSWRDGCFARRCGYAPSATSARVIGWHSDSLSITFTLERANCAARGVVLDEAGRSVPGCGTDRCMPRSERQLLRRRLRLRAASAEDSQRLERPLRVRRAPPWTVKSPCRAGRRSGAGEPDRAAPAERHRELQIRLKIGATLTGSVRTAAGTAVADAHIRSEPARAVRFPQHADRRARRVRAPRSALRLAERSMSHTRTTVGSCSSSTLDPRRSCSTTSSSRARRNSRGLSSASAASRCSISPSRRMTTATTGRC